MKVVISRQELEECSVDYYTGKHDISTILKKYGIEPSKNIRIEQSFRQDCFIIYDEKGGEKE